MNVNDSTSSIGQANLDTTLFVQKPYLRTNYIESDMEEDIDMKQKFKIKNLVDPINANDAANKAYIGRNINESTLLRIPTYEPLTNDYVSLKNTHSNKVIELATTNYVKDDISVKNYNKTNDTIDSIDVANHDFTPTLITLPTKQYMDEKIDERSLMRIPYYEDFQNDYIHLANDLIGQDIAFATTDYVDSKLANRARRSITVNPDIMRQDLEHTFASKFVYDNFYEIHRTGRFNASSEVSPDDSFLGIQEIITFGFAGQSSTEHTLTYDFKLIESTATHTNTNEFNVFIDLSKLTINETVEIAALYIEALNTSDQINENIDLKFQHKVLNSDNPTNEYDLVTKKYVDSNIKNNTIVRKNKNNIISNIGNPVNANDVVTKNYVDNDTTIVRNNQVNNFNNNIISNIGNPTNANDAVTKNYIDNDNTIVRKK